MTHGFLNTSIAAPQIRESNMMNVWTTRRFVDMMRTVLRNRASRRKIVQDAYLNGNPVRRQILWNGAAL